MELAKNAEKELEYFTDWIIITDNIERLENGEIKELHSEYYQELCDFYEKTHSKKEIDRSWIEGYHCKQEISDYFYTLINNKTPHASA